MKKIGILTLQEEDNYGAVLQAYALQKQLKKLGRDSELIRFDKQNTTTNTNSSRLLIKTIINAQNKRKLLFNDFREKYLMSSKIYKMNEDINDIYSCFIVGSDQVWNFTLPGVDGRYLLPFAQANKRCSYAASFGNCEIPEKINNIVKESLATFSFLSVREESGKRILKELIDKDVEVSLDPTLLLDGSDYEQIEEYNENKKYVFCFMLSYDQELIKQANEYAYANNLKLIIVTASFMPQIGINAWSDTGVEKWIGYIHHADVVFTNSFHCAVLSIIFERNLKVELLKGELAGRNGRITELLDVVRLNGAINVISCIPNNILDYLSDKRANSVTYLKRIVGNYD